MKKTITKRVFTFILLLGGMFSLTVVNAQNCPSNKVWACRLDACGVQECKCINANQVASWTAVIPPCNDNWWHHCCRGFRTGQTQAGMEIETSFQVYPNPVSDVATISFSLAQSQNVSLRIFDMNGRLVTTLANTSFEKGNYEIEWNAAEVNTGIYFLQVQSEENSEMIKLAVTK